MNTHHGPTSPKVTDNQNTATFNLDSHYNKYTKRTRRSLTRKLTQHFKRTIRNQNCPQLKPLSDQQIQHIRNTITNAKSVEICQHLCQEHDNGCIEYKWKLLCPQPDRLQHLITQMNYRLGEGNNICFYQIGVKDNGFPQGLALEELIDSVTTVYLMAKQICNIFVSIEKISKGKDGNIAKLKVVRNNINLDCKSSHISSDIRLLVAGNASVGKSTLIGVLTRGKLDDGCGSARKHVIQHRHEIRDGRTSSISYHILGFDSNGCITNYKAFRKSEWQEIIHASTKLITFVDQPGHNRYMKTSVSGLASQPHYVMLTVSLDEFDRKDDEMNGNCNGNNVGHKSTNELWSQMLSLNLDNLLGNDTDDTTTTTDIETTDDEEDYAEVEFEKVGQCQSDVQFDENFVSQKSLETNFGQCQSDVRFERKSLETDTNTNADTNASDDENRKHCKYRNTRRHRKENNLIRNELKLAPTTTIKSIDPSPAYHKYIKICNSINIPLFIVITKSDTDQHHNYQRLPKMIEKIRVMINKKFANYLKIKIIRTSSDVFTAAHAFTRIKSVTHIPIFICSCFNGEGLDLLKMFLFALETPAAMKNSIPEKNGNENIINGEYKLDVKKSTLMTEFGVYNIFNIPNVGIILGGIVRNGEIHVNDDMLLGPDSKGKYSLVTVQSIHVRKQPCMIAFVQQMASIQLSQISNISQVRRGMVLVSIATVPDIHTGYAFEAKIDILPACSIEEHSQPIVYVDSTRQSAHILQLKPNGKLIENTTGIGIFSFVHRPEYIRNDRRIIIRSSQGPIAIGIILRLLDTSAEPLIPVSLTKAKKNKYKSKKKSIKNYLSKWNLKNLKNVEVEEGGGSGDVFLTENELSSVGSDINESGCLKNGMYDRGSILAIMELEKIFSKSIEN